MRKLSFFVMALFAANLSFAQKGIELGVEFTPAATLILNDEDFAAGDDLNFQGTFGYNVGLSVGYNFNAGLGLASGILYSQQGQNYITAFDGVAKSDQDVFNRSLSYIRVPLLLKINSDPTASSGTYFRFGPHFDFLSGAKYSYDSKNLGTSLLDISDVSLLNDSDYKDLNIYNKFVFGITLEFGGSANINEHMKITFMLSLSGNLNSEGDQVADAASYGSILTRTPLKYAFDSAGGRSAAYNVMGGLNVGFRYTIPME
jgi:hypothetical protein